MKQKIIWILICLFLFPISAFAIDIESANMILYNLNENKIVDSKMEEEQISIASMTKIMTTLVAIEHIDNLDETVTLTNKVFAGLQEANASVAGFRIGQKVTYRDLLYGVLLPSGADAANALALFLAGSEKEFVGWMNEKAKELGLTNTHFENTTGLDKEGHYSTVKDVATMLQEALKNDTFKQIFESKSYQVSDKSMTLYSTLSTSLTRYHLKADYILGGKTGYTYDAGRCLASIAYDSKQDIYYLLVTARAPLTTAYYHLTDAIKIYDYYFENYGYQKVVSKGDSILTLQTKLSKEKEYTIQAPEDFLWYLNNNYNHEDITIQYHGIETITPFMKKGKSLGTIDIYNQNEKIGTMDITLDHKIPFSLSSFLLEYIWVIILLFVFFILLRIKVVFFPKKKRIHSR